MKKSKLVMLAMMLSLGLVSQAFAACGPQGCDVGGAEAYDNGAACTEERANGPCVCYCPMVRYVPQYYCTTRCEQEEYTVQKRCCRYVPQTYTTTHCRYVPEYYTQQHCRQVAKYDCVSETRYRDRLVKEQHCRYVPQYFTKKVCSTVQGNAPVDNCNIDPCQEYQGCGPCVCYCPMVRYVPQYYCTTRCEKEPYTVTKRVCRYEPEYYTTTHCRYRPEYYTKTHCRQVPEYYNVCETRTRPRYVKEQHCRYVPQTYVKKVCMNQADSPCANGGCQVR